MFYPLNPETSECIGCYRAQHGVLPEGCDVTICAECEESLDCWYCWDQFWCTQFPSDIHRAMYPNVTDAQRPECRKHEGTWDALIESQLPTLAAEDYDEWRGTDDQC